MRELKSDEELYELASLKGVIGVPTQPTWEPFAVSFDQKKQWITIYMPKKGPHFIGLEKLDLDRMKDILSDKRDNWPYYRLFYME